MQGHQDRTGNQSQGQASNDNLLKSSRIPQGKQGSRRRFPKHPSVEQKRHQDNVIKDRKDSTRMKRNPGADAMHIDIRPYQDQPTANAPIIKRLHNKAVIQKPTNPNANKTISHKYL
jgi:hypothetical protein